MAETKSPGSKVQFMRLLASVTYRNRLGMGTGDVVQLGPWLLADRSASSDTSSGEQGFRDIALQTDPLRLRRSSASDGAAVGRY